MIRLASAFWLLLVSAAALATFAVKYEVQALDAELVAARKATAAESRELRVLDAEWAYLNRPDTLAAMNQRFLSLAPISRRQLQTVIAEIPMRPAPVPPAPASPATGTGQMAALDTRPPENPASVVPASLEPPAAPTRLAAPLPLAAPPPSKETAPPSRPVASLDSRSLNQLIARIAAAR
jgi:hypothetical protein